ncbi:unnamed protein product [Ilex paraguariensis]|uniref:Cytochrome P450 n=1 Tax=Ilex paraguariensis TaxID=185542 RepID=A0ABC8U6F1_9AQUA
MEGALSFLVWSIIILSSAFLLLFRRKKSADNWPPPGPPGWPLFGHMFDLGIMPHKTLYGLREKYGPVIWLKLGSRNTMVLLTAKAATEFFKNHDLSFVDRSAATVFFKNHDLSFVDRAVTETMRSHGFNQGSVALAPYGTYWRVLKRIMTVEIIVNKRINETISIRRKCVDDMLSWIEKEANVAAKNNSGIHEANVAAKNNSGIQVARFIFFALFNMLGNLAVSRDLVDPESKQGSEFFNAMIGLMEWTGHPNVVDVFPWLRWLDPQGLRRQMDRDLGNVLRIASGIVKERMEELRGSREKKDFLDVLLEYEGNGKDEPKKISEHDLSIIILVITSYILA